MLLIAALNATRNASRNATRVAPLPCPAVSFCPDAIVAQYLRTDSEGNQSVDIDSLNQSIDRFAFA